MSNSRTARLIVPAVFVLMMLAWGPVPAQAAPVGSAAGAWQWVAEHWPGLFPASRPGRSPRPSHGSRKAGGCVDPDGHAITSPLCSAVQSLPDGPVSTNG
ncbi:MAG: hypothetical protein ACJ75H_13170 [Thermoanaerobaculia bacterium]